MPRAELARALEIETMGGTAALPMVEELRGPVELGSTLVRRAGLRLAHARHLATMERLFRGTASP